MTIARTRRMRRLSPSILTSRRRTAWAKRRKVRSTECGV
jgi:hypothetical protein